MTRRSNKDIVRIDGNVFGEQSEEEGVKEATCKVRGSGHIAMLHCND